MAVAEKEQDTEQLTYLNEGWQELANEMYKYAGDKYPIHSKPLAEHVHRKAAHANAAGKDRFTETVSRDDASLVRNAAHRRGVQPVSSRGE